MNINLTSLIKSFTPFVVAVVTIYILSVILYFALPKDGVERVKKQSINLEYKKFNIKNAFEGKVIKQKPIKVQKQEYQLLSNITLKAVYATANNKGWTVIEDNKKQTHMLSHGENFKGYILIRLYANYVVFEKGGTEYKLSLKKDGSNIKYDIVKTDVKTSEVLEKVVVKDDKVTVTRDYLNSYVENFEKIWREIAIREVKDKDGNIDGFKVNGFSKKSIFKKLGLKKGDIIKAVNNIELKSYEDAFNIYNNINKIKNINIKVLRANKEVELDYEIK